MLAEIRPGMVVVGTAHVSAKSVATVEQAIRERKPDKVLIELDARRLEAIQDPERWQKTDIVQVIKQKKQHLFLLQLYLANMQARIGKETGVSPGSEMLRAIEVAHEIGAEVVLIDRDVSITLKRGFGSMGFWQRLRLFWNVWIEILTPTHKDEALDVDELLKTDAISAMTEEFSRFAPVVKHALIDERDAYMASHIEEQGRDATVVAVVGAGHVPGIRALIGQGTADVDRAALDEPPKRRVSVGRIVGYLIPVAVLLAFTYLIVNGRWDDLRQVALAWILINGTLSALGALLAGGHVLSVLVAFIAAPVTSLNPALAAGWFAGLTEAKVRTPTVADFEAIQGLERLKDFWRNGVVRILLVTAFANLGSVAGTFVAGSRIFQVLSGAG